MRVLLLSNNENIWDLFLWLQERADTLLYGGKLSLEMLEDVKPDLLVSYNYRYIIPESIIRVMKGKAVNLHISLLPWNRGSSPNFWSFIEDSPKGVTIHQLAEGLDTGDIILQKELYFDEKQETFKSTYEALQQEITALFKENFYDIVEEKCTMRPQEGAGSYHTKKDMKSFLSGKKFSWDMNIWDFKYMESCS